MAAGGAIAHRGAEFCQRSWARVRVRSASAGTAARSRRRALCRRAGRHEPLLPSSPRPTISTTSIPTFIRAPAATCPSPKNLTEVRIGFFGPIEHNPEQVLRPAHAAWRADGRRRGQRARRLWRQALPPDAPQRLRQLAGQDRLRRRPSHRPHHLGIGVERSRQDGLRRPGLGHLRLHQLRVHAHCAARRAARRDSHRQLRIHRSHDPRNLHSLVFHRSSGRPRAKPHPGAAHLYRTRPQARRDPARQQSLWPLRRPQVSRRLAPAGPSRRDRAEVSCPAIRITRASCRSSSASRADAIVLWTDQAAGRRRSSSRCALWA